MVVVLHDNERNIAKIVMGKEEYVLKLNRKKYFSCDKEDKTGLVTHEFWHLYIDDKYPDVMGKAADIDIYRDNELPLSLHGNEELILTALNGYLRDNFLMRIQIRERYEEAALKFAKYRLKGLKSIKKKDTIRNELLLTNIVLLSLVTYIPFALEGKTLIADKIEASFKKLIKSKYPSLYTQGFAIIDNLKNILMTEHYPSYDNLKVLLEQIKKSSNDTPRISIWSRIQTFLVKLSIAISGIFVINRKRIKTICRHFYSLLKNYSHLRTKIIYNIFRRRDAVHLRLNLFIFGIIETRFYINSLVDDAKLRAFIVRQIGKGQRGKKLLSIGTGSGSSEKILKDDYGLEVTGIDLTKAVLKRAKENGVTVALGDGQKLPVLNEKFDIVIFIETIGHMMNPEEALREAFRVLKPGGKVYLVTYAYTSNRKISWLNKYKSDTLEHLTNILEETRFVGVQDIPTAISDYLFVEAVKPVRLKGNKAQELGSMLAKTAQMSI